MEWNKLVINLRKSMYLSQEELAKLLNVSFCSINRYENNKTEPTFKVQRKLINLAKKNKFDYKKYED